MRVPGPSVPRTVTGSPFVYTNASNGLQLVTVAGGVVPLIELDVGLGYLPAIGVAGIYPMFPGQSIRITYIVSPPTVSTVQL